MATIRKRLGKFQVQVRKDGNNLIKTFLNKVDALKWAREQEVLIEQSSYVSRKDTVTLGFLLQRWKNEVLIKLKSWRVDRYKVDLISQELGNVFVGRVTSTLLVEYRDKRLKVLSNQTVKHELGIIRRAMKKGIEWGYVTSIPFIRSPSLKGQARTRRLKDHEMKVLLDSCDEYLYHVVIVLMETAMRRGELVSILLSDIDLEHRLITLKETKNGESRIVPISNKALSSINYLLNKSNSKYLINYKKEWLTEKFITLCRNIGIENYRLHDLRHEAVSRLFEKGLNMMEVSTISGHKDLSMLKRYTHINPTSLLSKI